MTAAVVDAHVHVWDLQRPRPRLDSAGIADPAGTSASTDLRSAVAGTPVESVVLVQVINDADETRAFLEHARAEDLVAGVVGWIDLARPDLDEALDGLAGDPALVGIRHQALAEADPAAWLRSPAVQRGLSVTGGALGCPST